MKKLIILAFFSLLLAPEPWGIALNYETKECAGFWAGDERIYYELPAGWQAYYPSANDVIETDIGTCHLSATYVDNWEEQCCRELGYTYVADNIGTGGPTPVVGLFACSGIIAILAVGLAIAAPIGLLTVGGYFLWRRGKEKHKEQGPQL